MHVQPYQKKYLQGVPGSSPVVRQIDDLNYQHQYGKGPLIERAERLKRLQELKENMQQRVNERGESDDGGIRMIRDQRLKRIGVENQSRRAPSSNLDVIHKNKDSDVQILYQEDGADSNLPSIHGSQIQSRANGALYNYKNNQNYGTPASHHVGGSRFVKPPIHQIYAPNGRNDHRLREVSN